jgi:hypothetical protein
LGFDVPKGSKKGAVFQFLHGTGFEMKKSQIDADCDLP